MDKDRNMEAVVKELKAVREIMNLEAAYCYAADSYDGASFADVFTEDGVLDVVHMGKTVGREALQTICRDQFPIGFSFGMHFLHNPLIRVDGEKATGKFYWHASITYKETNTATWAAGTYDSQYIRTEEGWKIKEKVVHFFYDTPFDKGWVKERFFGQAG